jgi:hypothetical protein
MAMVLPGGDRPGMLEDVCLQSVENDPAMGCVEEYFGCLKKRLSELRQNLSKARVRSFLVSREVLEEAYFELLQGCAKRFLLEMPESPSTARVHTFLASRYKPALDLGLAAQANYWPLEHSAFQNVKQFLLRL